MGHLQMDRSLPWPFFLEEAAPILRDLARDASPAGVAHYLSVLAADVSRLTEVPEPEVFGVFPGFPKDVGFSLTHRSASLLGIQFYIEPNATLPCHPHPGASVCTLLLEGSARVQNYDFVDDEPDWKEKGRVLLRRTRDELLLPGRVNRLGLRKSNIHGMTAGPEGAWGIDLTTPHDSSLSQKDSLFTVHPEPVDAFEGIYEADWRLK